MKVAFIAVTALMLAMPAHAAGESFPDGRGGEVFFPEGAVSFADEVVGFDVGDPHAGPFSERTDTVLGVPDYNERKDSNYLTLGCGGVLTLAFTDNSLIDIPGPDLYVFEIGPAVEPTGLAISADGAQWTRVGMISGGKAEVDIGDYVAAGEVFRFVRLTDFETSCNSHPGADIDAVGAIGSATKITLDSTVLFDTGKHELKPAASAALDKVAAGIKSAKATRVIVEGHTDSVGSDEANMVLSGRRADAVAAYFAERGGVDTAIMETRALGETQPVATNDSAEGRQKNRRVEIVLHAAPVEARTQARLVMLGVWRSSHGRLHLTDEGGGAVTGHYGENQKGLLSGRFVSSTVFEGFWAEESASDKCGGQQIGRNDWGRVRIEFSDAAHDNFTAIWGNCDAEPTEGGWTGERLL